MMDGRIALLAGLLLVPAGLLWIGHGYRTLSILGRRVFWGGVIGHTVGILLTLFVMMMPPVWWQGGDALREIAVHWSLLFGAVVGGVAGSVKARTAR